MRPYTISCRTVNRFLADYLDDALEPATRERFEAHLHKCPNCEAYLDQYRKTVELVRDDDIPPPPPELVERTIAFLHACWEKEP